MATKTKKPARRRTAATAPDAIALLKADHAKVSAMFEQYDKLGDKAHAKKLELARRICNELKVHTQIEEEI
ncbi:MAG: hemerythrin domain-containing protein, partial [Usitatibacter sp.]